MGFNPETDLEHFGYRECRCGQRYELHDYVKAGEGEYKITARAVDEDGRETGPEDERLDADADECAACEQTVPFWEELTEGS